MRPAECSSDDCMMCTGEACNKCGAGCWNNDFDRPWCDHGVLERHKEPMSKIEREQSEREGRST